VFGVNELSVVELLPDISMSGSHDGEDAGFVDIK
jgi:hypothetical protein